MRFAGRRAAAGSSQGEAGLELPESAEFAVIGAGVHGLSTAWRLAQRLRDRGEEVEGRIVVIDKTGVAAGASGIACGVVRNNYFQPAMRRLMAHSVDVWESDPEGLSYHPVGYMQVSCEAMRADVASIHEQQREIGYESVFVEGANAATKYMRGFFGDWQARNITSVLHEKRGGYSNNTKSMAGLARKAAELGVRICAGARVLGFGFDSGSDAVRQIETDAGPVRCGQVVIGAGPWVRDFWDMLGLPKRIGVADAERGTETEVDMWRYWQLEEGVVEMPPETLLTDSGETPPVIHVDTDAPLHSDRDGSVVTDSMWGIYYKPDWHFGGVQGGASPYEVKTPVDEVAVDPYGPSSPEFVAGEDFAEMWTSALAHCHKRFEGAHAKFRKEPAGGIGCFTPDSFPVFDRFRENATVIADSNHGWKMIGVGHLVADELLGEEQELLAPFRFERFAKGELHPVSNSPYPWS